MAIGYILITTQPSKEMVVYNQLKEYPEVEEVHPLFGEYDIIAKIRGTDADGIGAMVVEKIREIDGIVETKTLMGISI
jgi:DNA-binding Lrp family transcriptional regulator